MNKSPLIYLLAAAAGCLLPIQVMHGQTSAPVGSLKLQCKAGSDTNLSIPFTRPSEYVGVVQSYGGNVINIRGANFSPDRFVYSQGTQPNHYYIYFGPVAGGNPNEGRRYDITANSSNTLTLSLNGDSLMSGLVGSQFSIIPHWTLATAFPASKANISFTPTTSSSAYKTEILIPDYISAGVNNVNPIASFFFSNNVDGSSGNVGWRTVGNNSADQSDYVLIPDIFITVRTQNSAPDLKVNFFGSVVTGKLSIPIFTQANNGQDNYLALTRPVPVSLNNCGLNNADGSFISSPQSKFRRDNLFFYDPTATGIQKAPAFGYIYYTGDATPHWNKFSDNAGPSVDNGADTFAPGAAFFIRKYPTSSGQTVFWTNLPNY